MVEKEGETVLRLTAEEGKAGLVLEQKIVKHIHTLHSEYLSS